MNPILPEKDLGIKAGLQVITTHAAHVLYKDTANLTGLNIRNHCVSSPGGQNCAASSRRPYSDAVGMPVLGCVVFEVFFLVNNGVRVSHEFVVSGQALIESCNFTFSLLHVHDALLSD